MALDPESQDAVAYLTELLRSYGLEELGPWAYAQVTSGNSPTMIRQLLWEQPAFKKRFKVIFDRRDRGLPAISVNEVLDYERSARQIFQAAGLPPSFYDSPDDFQSFILSDMALPELNQRVSLAVNIAHRTSAEARQEMQRLYGMSGASIGEEAAYILDPARALPIIESQFMSAQNAAASRQSGYGLLSLTEAERLTSLGVDPNQAAQGFASLVSSRQLFNALPGMETSEDAISREQQLNAAFGGSETDRQKLARRGEARAAASKVGGGFVSDREGFSGLGKANT